MKSKNLTKFIMTMCLFPLLLTGCKSQPVMSIGENGNWFADGVDTGVLAQGPKGEEGEQGVSVESTTIDDNGDLIVTFSNGETSNAGHVKDVTKHTVKFYCDDVLVDTQVVEHGEKVSDPSLDAYSVKAWYLEKEFIHEWVTYGYAVTEDMNLYGDYYHRVTFNESNDFTLDDHGYGEVTYREKQICVSKALINDDYLTKLEYRGILFNKVGIGNIEEMNVVVGEHNFVSVKMFYGNTPFSLDYSVDLHRGDNRINMNGCKFFTIQNTGSGWINIRALDITYTVGEENSTSDIPVIEINTKDEAPVTSRIDYVDCEVTTKGASKDVEKLAGKIKIHGNSTAQANKKPYRIKLDKKSALFGYTKAKNWALLADYLDYSNMHNYSALTFNKLVRGEETFANTPTHVKVMLNGEDMGLFLFTEHIEAKEGRLNIEQDNIWEKDFDDINFYVERDESTRTDPLEVEGETFFKVPTQEDYENKEYVFALKYPEKEDFEEELPDGAIDSHEAEFNAFFNNLKNYITDICNRFTAYYFDKNEFANVDAVADIASLAEYAVTDQAFRETDHWQKSFKMYRVNGGKLRFGPNWDYDSCVLGLIFDLNGVLNPYDITCIPDMHDTYFSETWGRTLFNDEEHGRGYFHDIWLNTFGVNDGGKLVTYLSEQNQEMLKIRNISVKEIERWYSNQYYAYFDNIRYYWEYMTTQIMYLYHFYMD